ncbi:hypothetical protein BJX66DRAFT_312698 [Aspergillus keveii]|uniref:Uncharacterized protein n=1 Tax=Aspergillus keveii TaxID=714993 RepID=A0ABR4FT53_9EURO
MLFSKLASFPLGLALVASSVAMPTSHGVQLNGTEDEIVPYAFPGILNGEEGMTVKPFDLHTVICGKGYGTSAKYVKKGIQSLRKKAGVPFSGPHQCRRVYESHGTEILWCNDADHDRELPSYNYIADGIQVVLNECNTKGGISGEIDHPDHWRANVHHMYNRNGKLIQ